MAVESCLPGRTRGNFDTPDQGITVLAVLSVYGDYTGGDLEGWCIYDGGAPIS